MSVKYTESDQGPRWNVPVLEDKEKTLKEFPKKAENSVLNTRAPRVASDSLNGLN